MQEKKIITLGCGTLCPPLQPFWRYRVPIRTGFPYRSWRKFAHPCRYYRPQFTLEHNGLYDIPRSFRRRAMICRFCSSFIWIPPEIWFSGVTGRKAIVKYFWTQKTDARDEHPSIFNRDQSQQPQKSRLSLLHDFISLLCQYLHGFFKIFLFYKDIIGIEGGNSKNSNLVFRQDGRNLRKDTD